MGYLRLQDYILGNIQGVTLTQLIQGHDQDRIVKERAAQSAVTSYLVQKFDCPAEFTDTTIFSPTTSYQGNSLIELNYATWVAGSFVVGQLVSFTDGNCYICILNTTSNQTPSDTTYWRLVGAIYALYYIDIPYPEFEMNEFYAVGDIIFWKGKVYQCLIPTSVPDHFADLNAMTYAAIPNQNVLPDSKLNGKQYWGNGVSYSVVGLTPNAVNPSAWAAGAYTIGQRVLYNDKIWQALTNNSIEPSKDIINWQPENWIYGDNRNPEIVECMVWITIRKLSPLISPRNVPVSWQKEYERCLTWLQMCAQGDITLQAPEIQPSQGARIRFGGNVKQINGY